MIHAVSGRDILDQTAYDNARVHLRNAGVVLPTFAELADPNRIPPNVRDDLRRVDPDAADPLNLFRVHWFNESGRRERVSVPDHVVLPQCLTGVPAPIVIALGNRFPLIRAHKVLTAYACLVPRIVTGRFDPTWQKAVWPSTGNYCRGGVAISRIIGCRGVAILPEQMSRERFRWLEGWVVDPADIVRTSGSESNVKEIYDKCAELERDPANVVLNQFSEFGNYLVHYSCTGRALEKLADVAGVARGARLRAFVAGSGSAGTLGAGDYLKERFGARIVTVEPVECPTLLYNGFGEHNIQGIGDKHVPLIHNVMNTDAVTAVSESATNAIDVLFNTPIGRDYLRARRKVAPETIQALGSIGLSGIANIIAAIKTAKYYRLGANDLILTIATDGAEMYESERSSSTREYSPETFDAVNAGEVFAQYLLGASTDHFRELTEVERTRMFNLGYFTWVEQRGVQVKDFEARRDQAFWQQLRALLPVWDEMVSEFNKKD
jgi:cysteine synthase